MIASSSPGGTPLRPRLRSGWRRAGRVRFGVSEVVATILLLAMTIALFAGLFFFVNSFGGPPPQAVNQFTASLSYGPCGAGTTAGQICQVSIAHLAGPAVTGASTSQTAIYLSSQNHSGLFPTPFSLSAGGIANSVWSFGQSWVLTLPPTYGALAPDNITVTVLSMNVLLLHVVLYASNTGQAPFFAKATVLPASVVHSGGLYNVTVQVQNSTIPLVNVIVKANVCQIQSTPCSSLSMTWAKKSGLFYLAGTTGAPAAGNFYIFVTASDRAGTATVAIPITLT